MPRNVGNQLRQHQLTMCTYSDGYITALAATYATAHPAPVILVAMANGSYPLESFKGDSPKARTLRGQLAVTADHLPTLRNLRRWDRKRVQASDARTLTQWCDHLAGLHSVACPCGHAR